MSLHDIEPEVRPIPDRFKKIIVNIIRNYNSAHFQFHVKKRELWVRTNNYVAYDGLMSHTLNYYENKDYSDAPEFNWSMVDLV